MAKKKYSMWVNIVWYFFSAKEWLLHLFGKDVPPPERTPVPPCCECCGYRSMGLHWVQDSEQWQCIFCRRDIPTPPVVALESSVVKADRMELSRRAIIGGLVGTTVFIPIGGQGPPPRQFAFTLQEIQLQTDPLGSGAFLRAVVVRNNDPSDVKVVGIKYDFTATQEAVVGKITEALASHFRKKEGAPVGGEPK